MTIRLSSGKECLLTWLGELHMNMINGYPNALTYNNEILTVNTLHQHQAAGHIMFKVPRLVLVPSIIRSIMDVPTRLPTLRLLCLHGRSFLDTNSQHRMQCISQLQETLPISTTRASTILPSLKPFPSWHNLYRLTAHCLRLFHLSQSNPEDTQDQ